MSGRELWPCRDCGAEPQPQGMPLSALSALDFLSTTKPLIPSPTTTIPDPKRLKPAMGNANSQLLENLVQGSNCTLTAVSTRAFLLTLYS